MAGSNDHDRAMSAAAGTLAIAADPMHGPATYFDGVTSKRHDVIVETAATSLRIINGERADLLDEWSYADLRSRSAPEGILRLGRRGESALARLEVRDAALAAAIAKRAPSLDRGGAADRTLRRRVVVLSLAAIASLVLTAVFGMPVLANRITPLVPLPMEKRFGEAIDKKIRPLLDIGDHGAAFQCGNGTPQAAGSRALDKLVHQLNLAANGPYHARVEVVRRKEANAFAALPGGHVYVFEGLLAKSETPDELVGVIAYEMGHVVHRDGTRAVLRSAGLSFLFGMTLGDFVGGGAVVIAAKTVLSSSYSRHAEAAADAYSVELMQKVEADPTALAAVLSRIASGNEEGFEFLRDHPDTRARIAAISRATMAGPAKPLLTETEWKVLKAICAAPAAGDPPDNPPKSSTKSKPPRQSKP
jgi:Zn-dependent protease with chaperone function